MTASDPISVLERAEAMQRRALMLVEVSAAQSDVEWVLARAQHDMAKYGEWGSDYDADMRDARERLRVAVEAMGELA
jgi:hypothetical protein